VIGLAERVTNDERVLAARLRELTLKISERKFDASHLPHATRRRLERKYQGRVEEILARAAMECVEALNEAFSDEE
jgi:hypothetical protein